MTAIADPVVVEVSRWLREILAPGAALVADSRAVAPGDAFFAYPGARSDGRGFIGQALARGAAALVVESGVGTLPVACPSRQVEGLKRRAGPIADAYHGMPTVHQRVVAVTGTNGKTSCSQWIAQGLHLDGMRTAVVGTLGAGVLVDATDGEGAAVAMEDTGLTTPDALALQALFARFAGRGVQAVAIEASSIGLHQHRLDGTRIAVAVHTNLTRDHLDYHGTMQAYAQAKAALFAWPDLQAAVVNLDDPSHRTMLDAVAAGVCRIGYRIQAELAAGSTHRLAASRPSCVDRILGARVSHEASGMRLDLDGDWGPATLHTRLLGRFNASNLLAVLGAWLALGLPFEAAVARLARLQPVPGRLQPVSVDGVNGPLAVVDYAHTPDALVQVLQALVPIARARGGLLWCVFGAGGDRDPGKRPLMGAAAERYADRVVLTSDNPRGESPEAILDAIAAGMSIPAAGRDADRARAIARTLSDAAVEDVVLIAGRGHESEQEIAGERLAFLDADHAARALARRLGTELADA